MKVKDFLLFAYTLAGVWALMMWSACQSAQPQQSSGYFVPLNTAPLTHGAWTDLLEKHVDEEGNVDYQGFQQDSLILNAYLDRLGQTLPSIQWSREEQLAYWINAYNAFTVKVIIDNYPLKSIRELHTIPGVATVWHKDFFTIGGKSMDLNTIEHKILRVFYDEPRIHFAINCASLSCPVLRREAYTAEQLEEQLTQQAQIFLSQPIRNQIASDRVALSPIFSWFRKDFVKNGTLIEFLNQYTPVPIKEDAKISYLRYDWSLNEKSQG